MRRAGEVPKIAMKKFITLATAGLFLLGLQGARAQRQVEPPAVPPMLEGQRPLAQPETKEPAAPKQAEEKAKPKATTKQKAKAGKKSPKKAAGKKAAHKRSPKVAKKKMHKTPKKKTPGAGPKQRGGPEEG
jgi:hypothetical protein